MVVFHLISSEGYYGAEAMLVELAGNASEMGCRGVVAAFRDSRRSHTEVADAARRRGLQVEEIPCQGRWDANVVQEVRRLMQLHTVDVLHTHGYKADFFGCLAARAQSTRLVATCHNWPNRDPVMRAYAVLDRCLLRRFDQVAAVSDSVASILRRSGFPIEKLATILNGVNVERFSGALPALRTEHPWGQKRLVGFAGRLVEAKGGAVLLRAAQNVLRSRQDTIFVFAGEGPLRTQWEAMAARLGIADSVAFLGVHEDMPGFYSSIDLLVLPSFEEASPLCVLEALAAGVPVVATCVGTVPQVIIPGISGLLVQPKDDAGLAGAILRLLSDPDLARSLGEQGRRHVARHFSARRMAASYLELYSRALAGRPHTSDATRALMER